MAQWLTFIAPHARDLGLIPGQGTKIPHVAIKTQCSQINKYLEKKKRYRDFSGGPVAKTPYSQCSRLRFNHWSDTSHAVWCGPPKKPRSNTATNSIKTLKMVYIKKIF